MVEKTNKQLLEDLGIDLKKINKDGKTLCPVCSHKRKKKNDPCLSVSVVEGKYNCWNDSCDFHGLVKGAIAYELKPKEYVRPKFNNQTKLSENAVNWFFKRGITQSTLNDCLLTEKKAWMPQTQKEENTINFNYFREGELINIKYRDGRKNFKLEKDAELIFYGLDDISKSDWCVIVEGEIDKLSFWQAGVKECVSVPNGASKSSIANLEYLDNCIDYFRNKTKIILATDDDEAGQSLREELARRLGYERCFKVDFKGCKDANEFLTVNNTKKLKELICESNLVDFPISGIITTDMIWDKVEFLLVNGLQRGDVTENLKDFDRMVSFVPGQFMVLTGIPNHGKSPFALMIMACLSIKYRWKWGLFTPEHKPLEIFVVKVCELLLGKRARKGIGFGTTEKELAKSFINEHFLFIEPEDEDYTLDNILDKAKDLVLRKGIRGLLIDPWNKLEHNIPNGTTETTYISKEHDKIIKFNQRNSVFSIVVAHPTKIRKNLKTGLFEVPNLYDISGSSNWFNKPDIGITFYRNYETKMSEVYVQKMKYDHLGEQGMCQLRYNMNSSRFNNQYGDWDNANWLLPNEPQIKVDFEKPIPDLNTAKSLEPEDVPF